MLASSPPGASAAAAAAAGGGCGICRRPAVLASGAARLLLAGGSLLPMSATPAPLPPACPAAAAAGSDAAGSAGAAGSGLRARRPATTLTRGSESARGVLQVAPAASIDLSAYADAPCRHSRAWHLHCAWLWASPARTHASHARTVAGLLAGGQRCGPVVAPAAAAGLRAIAVRCRRQLQAAGAAAAEARLHGPEPSSRSIRHCRVTHARVRVCGAASARNECCRVLHLWCADEPTARHSKSSSILSNLHACHRKCDEVKRCEQKREVSDSCENATARSKACCHSTPAPQPTPADDSTPASLHRLLPAKKAPNNNACAR